MTADDLTPAERRWHRACSRWYDHRKADHRIRAAIWGWISDRLVNVIQPRKDR